MAKFWGITAHSMLTELHGSFDTVVVAGWGYIGYLETVFACRLLGLPVLHLSESNAIDRPRSRQKQLAKRAFFRAYFGPSDQGLAIGSLSAAYFEDLGLPRSRVHLYPYTADVALTDAAWPRRDELRSRVRAELGLAEDDIVFLFSGKLIAKKAPDLLLGAFLAVPDPKARLVFVGTGDREPQLRAMAAQDPRCLFLGFRNQSELPALYAAADVLALPSVVAETWGLVVNEAMAMGCAVIVSDRVGSGYDLVRGQGTGKIVPAGSESALRSAIADYARDRDQRDADRARARTVVSAHTPHRAALGVRDAALAAVKAARPRGAR